MHRDRRHQRRAAQNTNRAPSGPPKSAGQDLLQKESVWKGYRKFPERFRNQNQLPYELRITSRKGKEFTGVATFDGTAPRSRGQWCEVAGSIERNGSVQWKTKTGSGTGDAGPSTATLVGNKLKFEFQTRRGNGRGELTLVSNAAASSDAPKNAPPGANETNGK